MTTQEVQEGKKSREPGYYWVTDPLYQRVIGQYDGADWWLIGWSVEIVEGRDITDINEKKIVEDGEDN